MSIISSRVYNLSAAPDARAWRQICKRTLQGLIDSKPTICLNAKAQFELFYVVSFITTGLKLPENLAFLRGGNLSQRTTEFSSKHVPIGAALVEFVDRLIELDEATGFLRLPDQVVVMSILEINERLNGPALFIKTDGDDAAGERRLRPTDLGTSMLKLIGSASITEFGDKDAKLFARLTTR